MSRSTKIRDRKVRFRARLRAKLYHKMHWFFGLQRWQFSKNQKIFEIRILPKG